MLKISRHFAGRLGAATLLSVIVGQAAEAQQGSGFTPVSLLGQGTPVPNPISSVNLATDNINVSRVVNNDPVIYGIPLGNFASSADLNNTIAQLNATATQINALGASSQSINSQVASLKNQIAAQNTQINRDFASMRSFAAQGAALAGSLAIVFPEPGDRFAFTLSADAFYGEAAGSVNLSYRVADRVLVFGGYARSAQYDMVKAGVSLSFH